ncbi:hypothetical protein [Pseudomonas silesiensis]|uniref:hypothetical protein n=1 Tax=Pseudomonas silesiensis TaxID=1853130 RepID=UPI0012B73F89
MTGDDFWKSWWAIILIGGPIMMGWVFIAHSLYISRYLPIMLKSLENSNYIVAYRRLNQGFGLPTRIFLVSQIAGMVIWPWLGIRAGQMDARDIQNFPPRLLSLLKINISILGLAIAWGGIAYVVVKLR